MKGRLLVANHVLLLLCASMYLGTGGSLVLFSFPSADQLTIGNYYLQLVPPIEAATAFLTPMTKVMLACTAIMLIAEWRQPMRWVPIVVAVALLGATALTVYVIFPLNVRLESHLQDAAELKVVLAEWMRLNRWRAALWAVQWAALAWYFARWTLRARYPDWER